MKIEFECNKKPQNITLDPAIYLFEVWGAQGGSRWDCVGGKGGYSRGILELQKRQEFFVYVGEQGKYEEKPNEWVHLPGGWNSGGSSRKYYETTIDTNVRDASSGGGSTDISIVYSDVILNETFQVFERTLDSYLGRVIVAGGGGGFATNDYLNGGFGGGDVGEGDLSHSQGIIELLGFTASGPGTQSNGGNVIVHPNNPFPYLNRPGSFGIGSTHYASATHGDSGGGGGGGWYGGGSGNHYPGSGGSGYVLTENSLKPPNYINRPDLYLKNAYTLSGNESIPNKHNKGTQIGNSGDGFVRITRMPSREFSNEKQMKKLQKKKIKQLIKLQISAIWCYQFVRFK